MRFVTRVGAFGVLRSEAGVLMVRHAVGPWGGSWDLPGGAIEPGEGPLEAVVRHLGESLGIDVQASQLVLRDAVADVAEWQTPDGITERLHRVAIVYETEVSPDVRRAGDTTSAWSPLNPRTPLADRFRV